jgi:2-polyprenyl-3-methyl-5-hydroxy-6-metoxy-1,4-benzoquinol methylase
MTPPCYNVIHGMNILRSAFSEVYSRLPEPVRRVAHLAAHCVSPGRFPRVRAFSDLSLLDAYLDEVDAAAKISDDARRKMFLTFEWRRPVIACTDPYAAEYRREQIGLYCKLAGVDSYDPANERTHFDIGEAVRCPFPYHTRSSQTVGDHLMSLGHLIKTAALSPGSRVLEFGPGWGNTTLALAQLGCEITAVEIEPNFIELIQRRVRAVGLEVETIQGDFSCLCDSGRVFDAVLFFESFHHSGDHLRLLDSLGRLVKEDGVAIFAGEPISRSFPVPWGVRLDGMSLWSIRRHRWLELGFRESYFVRTLARLGWTVTKHVTPATSMEAIYLARKRPGALDPIRARRNSEVY